MTLTIGDKLGKTFVITAELEPPRGAATDDLIRQAKEVKPFVSAVNVTDSPMASLRMSSVVAAYKVQQTGVEAIFHFTCRDRNSLALQAELLGAASLGLRTVLALTGDPPGRGDHPDAKGVFEVDTVGLVKMIRTLNEGRSQGKDLDTPTNFTVVAAANPGAKDLALEKRKVLAKLVAGASFFQTQPVFTVEDVLRFQDAFGGAPPAPVLYGVLPLQSAKMAARVGNWCRVPEALIAGLEQEGSAAGIRWAKRLVSDLKTLGVDGVHLYPLGRTKLVKEIVPETVKQAVAA